MRFTTRKGCGKNIAGPVQERRHAFPAYFPGMLSRLKTGITDATICQFGSKNWIFRPARINGIDKTILPRRKRESIGHAHTPALPYAPFPVFAPPGAAETKRPSRFTCRPTKGLKNGKNNRNREKILPGRGETVLLVEAEAAIMKMTRIMLERLAYKVLSANTPSRAMPVARAHTADIRLLITDVVMPEMKGLSVKIRSILDEKQKNI